jgi:RNA polymerase sigma-70 factor (ECF subfamily)
MPPLHAHRVLSLPVLRPVGKKIGHPEPLRTANCELSTANCKLPTSLAAENAIMVGVLNRQPAKLDFPRLSFENVARTELPVLYRVALRLAGNAEDAEDLVSQALLNAHRAWSGFDGSYPRSWLIKILKNEFLSQRRKRGGVASVSIEQIEEPSDEGFWEEVSWSSVGENILRELDRLPEEYRLVVSLCDVEEMSYEEAALALEIPIGTIRSRLFRGRRLLRARLTHVVQELDGGSR